MPLAMDRRHFLTTLAAVAAGPVMLAACGRSESKTRSATLPDSTRYTAPYTKEDLLVHPVDSSFTLLDRKEAYWKQYLSTDAYQVLFEEATEPRHSSPLLKIKKAGTFYCAACHLPLFPSTTKYDSGTGWPSFWAPIPGHVDTKIDRKLAMPRTEYHCARCGGHQGHVFEDGPDPTGLRYCNNGLALGFTPKSESLPSLRGA